VNILPNLIPPCIPMTKKMTVIYRKSINIWKIINNMSNTIWTLGSKVLGRSTFEVIWMK
jgi:hypothetical protein